MGNDAAVNLDEIVSAASILRDPGAMPADNGEDEALARVLSEAGIVSALSDWMDDPVFLIDSSRRVLHQNATATRVIRQTSNGIRVLSSRLILPGSAATTLDALIDALPAFRTSKQCCRAFRLRSTTEAKDWLVLLTALGGSSRQIIFMVRLVRRFSIRSLPGAVLQDLFGLSYRELVVTQRLLAGHSLRELAQLLSVSHETIRAHLKRVFRKCEVHSQTELAILVHRLSLFTATHPGDKTMYPNGEFKRLPSNGKLQADKRQLDISQGSRKQSMEIIHVLSKMRRAKSR